MTLSLSSNIKLLDMHSSVTPVQVLTTLENLRRRSVSDYLEEVEANGSSLLHRRGLVDEAHMKSRWPVRFAYLRNGYSTDVEKGTDLTAFSWLMVIVITMLDVFYKSNDVHSSILHIVSNILPADGFFCFTSE